MESISLMWLVWEHEMQSFLLERRGVKTIVSGRGKVVKQSLEPGHYIKKGERITLVLE